MEMTALNKDGKMVISLSGEIDHHSSRDIREGIDRLIVEERPKTLVLDLSGIDFMDSSGLGLVLGRYRKAKMAGTDMYLCGASERVKKILVLSGVDKLCKFVPEKNSAD